MDLCECVFVKGNWALSSQMSAEQSLCTITSGHLGPINRVRELQLALFSFVPYCLFILVLSFKSISSTSLSLSVSLLVFSFLSVSHPPLHECIHFSTALLVLQPQSLLHPLHLHIHTYCLDVFLSQLLAILSSLCSPLVFFCVCFSHLSLLLTPVKTSPPPDAKNSTTYLLFKCLFSGVFTRLSPASQVCSINHVNDCIQTRFCFFSYYSALHFCLAANPRFHSDKLRAMRRLSSRCCCLSIFARCELTFRG